MRDFAEWVGMLCFAAVLVTALAPLWDSLMRLLGAI